MEKRFHRAATIGVLIIFMVIAAALIVAGCTASTGTQPKASALPAKPAATPLTGQDTATFDIVEESNDSQNTVSP